MLTILILATEPQQTDRSRRAPECPDSDTTNREPGRAGSITGNEKTAETDKTTNDQ
jgi:hypothetical protein